MVIDTYCSAHVQVATIKPLLIIMNMKDKRTGENQKLMIIILVLLFMSVFLTSCAENTEEVTTPSASRYMDRSIYLSDPNLEDSNRNNFFQKEKIKDALIDVATSTGLGANYFSFTQAAESELEPVTVSDPNSPQTKSFILIWPDNIFNAYAASKYNSNIPDLNAITVINEANKKQFFMIFRASCFQTSSVCGNIGVNGFKALVARQLGLLVGLNFNCTNPLSTMCQTPSDSQWNEINKFNFSRDYLNQLSTIDSTPNFYTR
jgi:hypothetical protein